MTNFGFSIPSNAIITGVTVELRRLQNSTTSTSITDNNVQLINNLGALIGNDLSNGNEWSTTEELITYGGNTNTWGLSSLTPAILNSSSFGFSLRAQSGTNSRTGSIDQIQMSITYIIPKYFKSRQATGNFSSTSTWSESTNATSWANATSTPSVNDLTVSIESGHNVTISADVTSDQVTIQTGGQVTVSSGQTWTINNGTGTDLDVNGTLSNAGTLTQGSSTAAFNSGSTYNHNVNGGNVPNATWQTSSTCLISGTTTADVTGLDGQTLGNFTYNSTSQTGRCDLESTFSVTGKFLIQSTGTSQLCITINNNETITVADFEMTGGTFRFSDDNAATGVLNVSGSFKVSAGVIDENTTRTDCAVNFNGSTTQIFTSGGSVTGDINFTVNNGAILQMAAESTIVNGASFTLSSGGTLDIKSAGGIATSGATGNIRTTTRTFSNAANYIYSGASQSVGNGLLGSRNLTLSGSGTKTFAAANFTGNVLGVSVDLNINTRVVASIPSSTPVNTISVSSKLYLGGVGKINGSYGSTTSAAANKTNTFFAATTGTVNAVASARQLFLPHSLPSLLQPTPLLLTGLLLLKS